MRLKPVLVPRGAANLFRRRLFVPCAPVLFRRRRLLYNGPLSTPSAQKREIMTAYDGLLEGGSKERPQHFELVCNLFHTN